MNLRISGKQMDIGDAFRTRIEGRIGEAVDKYFNGSYSGRVTVEKSGSRFSADCMIHLDSGMAFQAAGEAQEPTSAFDAAAERIEKRLRRYKRRLKSRKASASEPDTTAAYRVVEPLADDDSDIPDDYAPAVVAESTVSLSAMTVASAVIELDSRDDPVFVFRQTGTGQVNIVYRRADGNIGWIDPAGSAGNG
jgi:ribosomal subunit interface protein